MASQRKAGALLGYANILAKNLVNLVYTPMLLSYVGQADYGVFLRALLHADGGARRRARHPAPERHVPHALRRRHSRGGRPRHGLLRKRRRGVLGRVHRGAGLARPGAARHHDAQRRLDVVHRRVQFLHHGARALRLPADQAARHHACDAAVRLGPAGRRYGARGRCPSTARGEPRPARPQRALRHRRAGHALRAQGCRLGRHARHRRLQCLDLR